MSDEELDDEDTMSEDSICIEEVLDWVIEDDRLCYVCRTGEVQEVIDRSDLMDGAEQQRLVLQFERRKPPPWDEQCPFCDGDGCEECVCDECERPCRQIKGVNYGCCKHPVI